MIRFLSFIFIAFIFSCSIIEESDITSQKEFDDLRFTSIGIKQETSSGSQTVTARVTTDSVVNIPVPGGTITRTVWMDWPALGSSKLKLKSGFTGAFKSYTSFLASGKPYTFYLFDSDTTLFELYRFRYDASGRLNKIVTFAPAIDGQPATSNDTLIYDTSGNLTRIDRRSSVISKIGTFTFEFQTGSFNNGTIFKSTFQGRAYRNYYGNSYYSYLSGNGGGGPDTNDGALDWMEIQKQSLSLIDRNFVNDDCQCRKWIDTFYFHPVMILKDQFELGNELLFIYMVDWWQPISSVELEKDEKVTFIFKYDL